MNALVLNMTMLNLQTKFEIPSFTNSKYMKEDPKHKIGVNWGGYAIQGHRKYQHLIQRTTFYQLLLDDAQHHNKE